MYGWRKDVITVLFLTYIALILGWLTGLYLQILLVLVSFILIRQSVKIAQLERWLKAGGNKKTPKSSGIWEEIYFHFYKIKKLERKRKKKLGKMIDQFRHSTEALPDAAVVLGENEEIQWVNRTARQLLGLKKSDKGQRLPNLIRHPDFVNFLKNHKAENNLVLPAPTDNQMILQFRLVAYGTGLHLLLAHDVTHLKNMERIRTDFVANVSHELRTPLTVLKGYLETLQEMDTDESKFRTNSYRRMLNQTERMQYLVDDLLLLTRLETKQREANCVDIPALLDSICHESDWLGDSEQRIQLSFGTDDKIMGDEQELRSAFSNLIVNALKYSPLDSLVKVGWYSSEKGIRLDVEDQGEGISKQDIPRITERFYRVDIKRSRKKNGTGLGLAIVKHVLVRHDATLKISSSLGEGSLFSCQFPKKRIC